MNIDLLNFTAFFIICPLMKTASVADVFERPVAVYWVGLITSFLYIETFFHIIVSLVLEILEYGSFFNKTMYKCPIEVKIGISTYYDEILKKSNEFSCRSTYDNLATSKIIIANQ